MEPKERNGITSEEKGKQHKEFMGRKILGMSLSFSRKRPIFSIFLFLCISGLLIQIVNSPSRPSRSQMSVADFEQNCRDLNTSDCDNKFVTWEGYFNVQNGSIQLISLPDATPVVYNERSPGAFAIGVSERELTSTARTGLQVSSLGDGFHYGVVSGFLINRAGTYYIAEARLERVLLSGDEAQNMISSFYEDNLAPIERQMQAEELGFETADEMQSAQERGFNSAEEEAEAAEAGFDTRPAYDAFLEQQRLEAQAAERGFETVEAMQDARQRGFSTAEEEQEAANAGFETREEFANFQAEETEELLEQFANSPLTFISSLGDKGDIAVILGGQNDCRTAVNLWRETPSGDDFHTRLGEAILYTYPYNERGTLFIRNRRDCRDRNACPQSAEIDRPARVRFNTVGLPQSFTANWVDWRLDWREFSSEHRIVLGFASGGIEAEFYVCARE